MLLTRRRAAKTTEQALLDTLMRVHVVLFEFASLFTCQNYLLRSKPLLLGSRLLTLFPARQEIESTTVRVKHYQP